MITEFFLNIVFNLTSGFLNLVPDISWSVDTTAFAYVSDILSVVGYMVPMKTVVAIVAIIISLTLFRIVISAIKTFWDLLPFA